MATNQKVGGSNPFSRTNSSQATYRLRRAFSFHCKAHRALIETAPRLQTEPAYAGLRFGPVAARRFFIAINCPFQNERTSERMSFCFGFRRLKGRLHPSVSECLGAAKPPLRQGFGLRPKRLYAAKAARPRRAVGWYFCEQGLS